jgi:hypothetical protein
MTTGVNISLMRIHPQNNLHPLGDIRAYTLGSEDMSHEKEPMPMGILRMIVSRHSVE